MHAFASLKKDGVVVGMREREREREREGGREGGREICFGKIGVLV